VFNDTIQRSNALRSHPHAGRLPAGSSPGDKELGGLAGDGYFYFYGEESKFELRIAEPVELIEPILIREHRRPGQCKADIRARDYIMVPNGPTDKVLTKNVHQWRAPIGNALRKEQISDGTRLCFGVEGGPTPSVYQRLDLSIRIPRSGGVPVDADRDPTTMLIFAALSEC
jgi:hypothetical protein